MLEKKEILERLRRVQLLILDVDGVLTDGSINIGPDGKEVFKKFDVKDGHALKHQVHDLGVRTAIITGHCSKTQARETAVCGSFLCRRAP